MEYKLIRLSSEPKVVGVRNGGSQMEINRESLEITNKEEDQIFWNFVSMEGYFRRFIEESGIRSIAMNLLKNAKLTDFMRHSPQILGSVFSVSEPCFSFLKRYNLDDFYSVRLNLINNKELEGNAYHLILHPFINYNMFDFKGSVLYSGSQISGKTYYKINDFEEFKSLIQHNPLINFEKVAIKSGQIRFDILNIRGVGLFMSDKFLDGYIEKGFTGLNIPSKAPILKL